MLRTYLARRLWDRYGGGVVARLASEYICKIVLGSRHVIKLYHGDCSWTTASSKQRKWKTGEENVRMSHMVVFIFHTVTRSSNWIHVKIPTVN